MNKETVVLLLVFLTLSSAQVLAGGEKRVSVGAWRGEGMELTVTEQGATVEFPCARAEISQPLTLDKKGKFDVTGRWYPEHPGPVRDEPRGQEAKFSGNVSGEIMTVNVRLTTADTTIGDFELTLNGTARLKKCR